MMSNATAKDVMRIAIMQTGYTESPAGSNRTKFGKKFGMNGQPWCFIYEWWCGDEAKGNNPFPHNANAAYGQDDIVSKMGGKWVMKKTASNKTKKEGLKKVQIGDCVDFDFGRNNKYRQHTALCVGVDGDYYICQEGNTSSTDKGSQSNGGGVFRRYRHYTQVCSIARPKYSASAKHTVSTPYAGKIPTLPKRGYFRKGDKGTQVKHLQEALKWATGEKLKIDGEFGNATLFAVIWFQHMQGIAPDGEFGKTSLAKLNALVKSKKKQDKSDCIVANAVMMSYPSDASKKEYSLNGGAPKATYKAALNKIFPNHGKWKKEIRTGASCIVFVATLMKSCGVDKSFMCDDPCKVYDYLVKSDKWKKVNSGIKPCTLKAGDIICYHKPNDRGHICIVVSSGYIAEANYGRYYPHRTKTPKAYLNELYIKNTYKRFGVFRIKE